MILITGSEGLIGRSLISLLRQQDLKVREFDIRRDRLEDIRSPDAIRTAMHGIEGVVHLAAVSRVVWAQNYPILAKSVNIAGLENILEAISERNPRPWIIFASSREVYGQATDFPVHEDAPYNPLNTYAETKVKGEQLIHQAISDGICANICRFSNVYGAVSDHRDRVAVAFARTAAFGGEIRIDGEGNIFDLTYVSDVVKGLYNLIQATHRRHLLPPIHFVSGKGVNLKELSQLAVSLSRRQEEITVSNAPPREFDVAQFIGNPNRAKELLGWSASTPLHQGMGMLIDLFQDQCQHVPAPSWLFDLQKP